MPWQEDEGSPEVAAERPSQARPRMRCLELLGTCRRDSNLSLRGMHGKDGEHTIRPRMTKQAHESVEHETITLATPAGADHF